MPAKSFGLSFWLVFLVKINIQHFWAGRQRMTLDMLFHICAEFEITPIEFFLPCQRCWILSAILI